MKGEHHDDFVEHKEVEEYDVIFMVELADADTHEDAMMVIFMYATIAFIAMSHSYPFI